MNEILCKSCKAQHICKIAEYLLNKVAATLHDMPRLSEFQLELKICCGLYQKDD
jgi:hypothetical protein